MIRPEIWLNEACNLFYSADVLGSFEAGKLSHLRQRNDIFASIFAGELIDRAYFNWRVQRILWAYGFENLLKCIILIEHRMAHTSCSAFEALPTNPSVENIAAKKYRKNDVLVKA